jgi:hypothetical protein
LGSHFASISNFKQSEKPKNDALWAAVSPPCNSAHKRKWLIEAFKLRVISLVVRFKGDARMESHADVQLGPCAFNLILCAIVSVAALISDIQIVTQRHKTTITK